jgi:uncharacterized peroxidase-related enzyme
MPRLTAIDPARAEGKVKEIFEGPLKGKHFNIFKAMAGSPAALEAYVALSGALHRAKLSAKERELIALAIAEDTDCGYCVAAHTALARMAGLSEQEALDARTGRIRDPKHAALLRFIRAIHEKRGRVSDADVQAFRDAGYADAHIAEAVASYALNVYTVYFNHVNETVSDFPPAPALK